MLVLYASDIHAPFHDKSAVELLIAFTRKVKPDVIHLGGDTVDFYAVSSYDKDPARKLKLQHEIDTAKGIIRRLREAAPNARMEFREGNHEFRLRRFLNQSAEVLSVLDCLSLPSLLDLPGMECRYLENKQLCKRGKLFYMHGDEVRAGGSHPAFTLFNKLKSNLIFGHFHRAGSHIFRDFGGTTYGAWAAGCLCDLHPTYAAHNQWSHGFVVVEYSKTGRFQVEPVPITKKGRVSECMWRGKTFTATAGPNERH